METYFIHKIGDWLDFLVCIPSSFLIFQTRYFVPLLSSPWCCTCSSPAPSATISTITFPNATVSSQPACRTDFMLAGAWRERRSSLSKSWDNKQLWAQTNIYFFKKGTYMLSVKHSTPVGLRGPLNSLFASDSSYSLLGLTTITMDSRNQVNGEKGIKISIETSQTTSSV